MRIALLILLSVCMLNAAQVTNLTSLAAQTSFTNAFSGGDTIWIDGSQPTFSPPYTNAGSLGEYQWTVGLVGAVGNPITIRSLPGTIARFDLQWRFGFSSNLVFRDIEFFDSRKGIHATNVSYPLGPWLHFDGDLSGSSGNEWINCIVHDVNNAWSGGTAGHSIRGCIIWNVGLNGYEHVCYPAGDEFTGNITGWHVNNVINLTTRSCLVASNIMFGAGQTTAGFWSDDLLMSLGVSTVVGNSFYNRYYTDKISVPAKIGGGGDSITIVTNNYIVTPGGTCLYSNLSVNFSGNTVHMNGLADYPVIDRYMSNFTHVFGLNHYTVPGGREVVFEDQTMGPRRNFAQWQSLGYDLNSTATNGAVPPDRVFVYPNADEAKRAHIAVYNFSSNNNVTVSFPAGLFAYGDTVRIYSALNYNAGPILTTTYNGTSISVPMTNLSVQPLIYGTNWGLITPMGTSPEFGAFVVTGQSGTPSFQMSGNVNMSGNWRKE